ncbi:MAG: 3-oxoacyl-ACP reductase, partial [Rhodanobacteraceae bacterium]
MNVERRRALVTGGSGDIGGAICRALAKDGYH